MYCCVGNWLYLYCRVGNWLYLYCCVGNWLYLYCCVGNWLYLYCRVGNWLYLYCRVGNWLYLYCRVGNWLYLYCCVGNWLYLWFNSSHRPKPSLPPTQPLPLSQTTWDVDHTHFTKEDRFKRSSTPISSEDESDIEGGYGIETLTHTPTKPVHSTSLRHSLMSKCAAKTRTGSRCKFAATPGENHCRRHLGMNH